MAAQKKRESKHKKRKVPSSQRSKFQIPTARGRAPLRIREARPDPVELRPAPAEPQKRDSVVAEARAGGNNIVPGQNSASAKIEYSSDGERQSIGLKYFISSKVKMFSQSFRSVLNIKSPG